MHDQSDVHAPTPTQNPAEIAAELRGILEPIRKDSLIRTANEYLAVGDHVNADRFYQDAVYYHPTDSRLLNEYANNLIAIGAVDQAKDIFLQCFDSDVNAPSNYMLACDYLGVPVSCRAPVKHLYNTEPATTALHDWRKHDKIRLCYITGDAHIHASGREIAAIMQAHDRDRFEITLIYTGPYLDPLSLFISKHVDRFVHADSYPAQTAISNPELYAMIRGLEIDILIDLDGHTNGGLRLPIFAHRPAHKNVTLLGYPNTTGFDFFDLRVGSGDCFHYEEPFVANPHGYMPIFKTHNFEWQEKKTDGLVLGVISSPSKITAEDIARYDMLLSMIPNAQLRYARLKRCYSQGKAEWIMRQHLPANRERVSIQNMMGKQYLDMFATIDVLLDTSHWNLHATMLDALSCGVPVLNLDTMPIAQPSAHLNADVYSHAGKALGVSPDTITEALMDYKHMGSKAKLTALSRSIHEGMQTFDNTEPWVRAYEGILKDLLT